MKPLLQQRLILVMGKGGVGRSTVAASIAMATAKSGRRTLLFQANAKDRFGAMFGQAPLGPEITELRENLFSLNTSAEHALEEYGLMILRFRRVYKLVFENRMTEAFLKAIPGIEEYSILGKAWYHTQETKKDKALWDTVVFDMAASGHSLSMLRIPWAIGDAVPDGPLSKDAKEIKKLLTDPERTAAVLVTLAEEMPSNEAIELSDKLQDQLGIKPSALVINQVYGDQFPAHSPQAKVLEALAQSSAQKSEMLQSVTKAALQCQSRRELNEGHLARLRTLLTQPLTLPQILLPKVFLPKLDEQHIAQFANQITDSLSGSLPDSLSEDPQ